MVIPRVGQDPVCYAEVAEVQRSAEAKPLQDEKTTQRATRKKSATGAAEVEPGVAETKTRRRTTTSSKKSAASADNKQLTAEPKKTRKTTARASTTKKTSTQASTTKKTTSSRARRGV
jgi:DNA topoisomerase-1